MSKSFVLSSVEALQIPGTVSPLTRQTLAAADTNTDERGVIRVMHEMSDELLLASTGKPPQIQTTFKNYITSGEVTVQRHVVGAGGVSTSATSRSVKQMALLGASNLRAEQIAPAVASRFVLVNMNAVAAHTRTALVPTMLARLLLDSEWRALGDAMQYEMRITQAMTFWIMSAIAMGGLPDVTFAVLAVVLPLYCRVLSARFGIEVAAREVERTVHLVRVLVLWQATWWLYTDPQSAVRGAAPAEEHALLTSPILKDSEEIVHFALDLLAHQVISLKRTKV